MYCIVGFYCEKKYLQITHTFALRKMLTIFEYCIHNRKCIEDYMDPIASFNNC